MMTSLPRLLVAVALLALLAGCAADDGEVDLADPDEESDASPGTSGQPDESPDPEDGQDDGGEGEEEETEDGDVGMTRVLVFGVRDAGGHLWVESEQRTLPEPTNAVATAAMTQLFTVPSPDPGLWTPAGTGVEVLGVSLEDGLLTVDVSAAIADASLGAAGEGMFRRALAHTATQFRTVDAVELRVEGEAITELWGHIEWTEPATPDPDAVAPIDVDDPTWGDEWGSGPLTVRGTSRTFESTVELDLIAPDGTVVESDFTTAAQPDVGRRGPFEHRFDEEDPEPGTWTVRVREPDPSGGEGRPPYVADIAVIVE